MSTQINLAYIQKDAHAFDTHDFVGSLAWVATKIFMHQNATFYS